MNEPSKPVIAICVAITMPMWIASCAGDSDSADDSATTTAVQANTPDETTAATEPRPSGVTDMAPHDLGVEIGAIYLAVYDDVIATVVDRPEAAQATERLTDLKEGYIEQLVALGQQREPLDRSSRATVDAAVTSALMSLPEETLAAYQATIDHYAADAELNELIRSFNIIGQYASFDLLREQEPDEAARLGIG
jgi:hypothetical protein